MHFGLGTLTRTALLAGVVLVGACGDDGTEPPPPNQNPAPTGLAAASTGTTSINVTWTAPTTAVTQFVLQRSTGGGAFAEIARPAAAATSYADAGLTANTQYSYRLAAVRNGATSDFSTTASATTDEEQQPSNTVDVTANITANTTWTADKTYILKGFIKVANGATLTIQAGTKIVGDFETLGASLFVLRGARIVANGTAANPIVFTSARMAGERQPGDWGGLIIVGNARINRSGTVNIEGTGTNAENPLVPYSGGDNDFDNSGTLRYVRVEYAGYAPAQDAELNSFTIAAVGSQTTMEYLQALNGLDDHFEFFGGTVDGKYLVSYESGDDHFDMSEGYRGRLQYLIAYQSKVLVPRAQAGGVSSDPQGIENDGCGSNAGGGCDLGYNSTPLTTPVIANFTLVGTGPGVVGTGGGYGMVLRRGVGGHYVNGILARWPNAAIGYRDAQTKQRETEGVFSLQGIYVAETTNLFQAGQQTYGTPANLEHSAGTTAASLFTALPANPAAAGDFDWSLTGGATPATGGVAAFAGDLAQKAGTFVTGTTYRGAAQPGGTKWWAGWTEYSDN